MPQVAYIDSDSPGSAPIFLKYAAGPALAAVGPRASGTQVPGIGLGSVRQAGAGDRALRMLITLGHPAHVGLALVDVLGRLIATRDEGVLGGGNTDVTWRLPDLASGLYFVVARADGGASASAKVVLTR